ncbi:Pre-mRNA-splicing factor CLF1 [Intoshia linei]|uniref:Pre-mRNA-splicing factor CLF1 n=1 Tax=Intoshia linei TaxID=1819745 RepID=A0A177B3G0_9BILA|nr:Pre-mRNA-splicing factor CLF1 [Intoshia linei]
MNERAQRRVSKVAKVKNKAPAAIQITAEQLIREAKERELELVQPPPVQKINDEEELRDFRIRKRKEFEDVLRRNKSSLHNWLKYADWEIQQKEIERSRSVYERCLDVDHRIVVVWLRYAEMEMKNKQINHARNLWDRAVTLFPRVNQFWYKYAYMEEMLKNVPAARQIFERWMEWQPDEQAWHSYINFELRYNELNRARMVYEKFIYVHPNVHNWLKYARFEERGGAYTKAREIYERAVTFFGDEYINAKLMIGFAKFEERRTEHERARVIYKYSMERLTDKEHELMMSAYVLHQKKFGEEIGGIEDVIVGKRKIIYQQKVDLEPDNYDVWFDYIELCENENVSSEQIRELYEIAISNVPNHESKKLWKRYVYIWIKYAIYEEVITKEIEKSREIFNTLIDLIPHKMFTFGKVWLMYAKFELRQLNLKAARSILGRAIGMCPKSNVFQGYIDMELQLRQFDRCRILYEKYLCFNPKISSVWIKYSEMEILLGDDARARAIFELAIDQQFLDMPEIVWKAYIDFETDNSEFRKSRALYRKLIEKSSNNAKVWISFGMFEFEVLGLDACNNVFDEGYKILRTENNKEHCVHLLAQWRKIAKREKSKELLDKITKIYPEKVKKRKKIESLRGMDEGYEEYYDFIFPDEKVENKNLKLLAMAKNWKVKKPDTPSETLEENNQIVGN